MLSDTTRHLARRLNKQVSRVRDPSSFPTDVLHADQVAPSFLQQVGFPEAADSVAYEPVQRLLAVGAAPCCLPSPCAARRPPPAPVIPPSPLQRACPFARPRWAPRMGA
jgi:hypothetical protein